MFAEASAIVQRLNSPADWFVVLGAATVGGVLDAAINIVPIPIFSPGYCSLAAASAAMTLKKGWDASAETRDRKRRLKLLRTAGQDMIRDLNLLGLSIDAKDLALELELAASSPQDLERVVRENRQSVRAAASIDYQQSTRPGHRVAMIEKKEETWLSELDEF